MLSNTRLPFSRTTVLPLVKPSLDLPLDSFALSEHIEYILGVHRITAVREVEAGEQHLDSETDSENSSDDDIEEREKVECDDAASAIVPRPYQFESYLRALYTDVGIILPTGSGKTLVAAMLLYRMGHLQCATQSPLGLNAHEGLSPPPLRRVGVFISEKQLLVEAQSRYLENYATREVRVFRLHGQECYDVPLLVEACDPRNKVSRHTSVILVATPEALRIRLDAGELSWGMVHTLILDELHHWSGSNHPFDRLMENFQQFHSTRPRTEAPRLLGLSASVSSSERGLPIVFPTSFPLIDADAVNANPSRTNACESHIFEGVQMVARSFSPAQHNVHRILHHQLVRATNIEKKKKKNWRPVAGITLGEVTKRTDLLSRSRAQEVADLAHCMIANETLGANVAYHSFPHFFQLWESPELLGDDSTSPASIVLKEIKRRICSEAPLGISSSSSAADCDTNGEKDTLCLLLVQMQISAYQLTRYLESELPSSSGKFVSEILVGNRGAFGMHARAQQRRIEDFAARRIRILVATTVAEEGVDISGCDFVARLDTSKVDTRIFIQVKGRARKAAGRCVMFFFPSPAEVALLQSQIMEHREQQMRFRRGSRKYLQGRFSRADMDFENDLAMALQIEASRQATVEDEREMKKLLSTLEETSKTTLNDVKKDLLFHHKPKFTSVKAFTEHLNERLNGDSSFEVRAIIQSILDGSTLPMHHIEAIAEIFIEKKSQRRSSDEKLRWPRAAISFSLDPRVSADAYKSWFKKHVLAVSPPMIFDWDDGHNSADNNEDPNDQHLVLKCVMMSAGGGGGGENGAGNAKRTRTIWYPPKSERTARIFRILKNLRQRWLFVSFDVGGKLCAVTEAQGVPMPRAVRADRAPLREILMNGISLFGVRFEVLCASASQLRAFTPAALFIEAGPNAVMTPTQWRQYLFPISQGSSSPSRTLNQPQAFKLVSRIGLYSATDICWDVLPPSHVAVISDVNGVESDRPLLTDGCGFITRRLTNRLLSKKSAPLPKKHSQLPSSLVQFRYAGLKGVLLVLDDDVFLDILSKGQAKSLASGNTLVEGMCEVMVRPSQIKFSDSCSDDFCVVRTSDEAGAFTLNREIINLMVSLKAWCSSLENWDQTERDENPQDAFENYVLGQLDRIQQSTVNAALGGSDAARDLIRRSIPAFACEWNLHALLTSAESSPHRNIYNEPFVLKLLATTMSKIWSEFRFRFRIPFGQGCKLLGCADPFGLLKDGEIFAQIRVVEDSRNPLVFYRAGSLEADELITMGFGLERLKCILMEKVLVCRNPCVHPGDVQICRAVDLSALDHRYNNFINVVLFPCNATTTTYSIPHRCSGGDLDGDEFSITWDPSFTSHIKQYSSFSYDENEGVPSSHAGEAPKTEAVAVAQCMETCMNNTALLGSISNMHASACEFFPAKACDRRCISLVKALSLAMDFPKKGIVPEFSKEVKEVVQAAGYPVYIRGSANRSTLRSHSLLTTIFEKSAMPHFLKYFRRDPAEDRRREALWAATLGNALQKALSTQSLSLSSSPPSSLPLQPQQPSCSAAASSVINEDSRVDLLNKCSQLWRAITFASSRLRDLMTECHLKCESELFVGCVENSDPMTAMKSVLGRETQAERVSAVLETFRIDLVGVPTNERGGMSGVLKGLLIYVCSHYPVAAHAVLTQAFENELGYELTSFMDPTACLIPLGGEVGASDDAVRGGVSNKRAAALGFSCLGWSCGVGDEFFDMWSKYGVEGLSMSPTFSTAKTPPCIDENTDDASIDTIATHLLGVLHDGIFDEKGNQNAQSPSAAIFSRIEKILEGPASATGPTMTLTDWRRFLMAERKGVVVAIRVVLDWASETITELRSLAKYILRCRDDNYNCPSERAKNDEVLRVLLSFIEKVVRANTINNKEIRRREGLKFFPAQHNRVKVAASAKMPAKRFWTIQISMLIAPLLSLFEKASSSARDAARVSQLRLLQTDDPCVLLCGKSIKARRAQLSLSEISYQCVKENPQLEQPKALITTNGRGWHHDKGTHFFYPSPLWGGLTSTSEKEAAACTAKAISYHVKRHCWLSLISRNQMLPNVRSIRGSHVKKSWYISSVLSVLWSAIRANFTTQRATLPKIPSFGRGTRRWKVSCRFGKHILLSGLASLPPSQCNGWSMRTLSYLASNRTKKNRNAAAPLKPPMSDPVRHASRNPSDDRFLGNETVVPAVAHVRSLAPSRAQQQQLQQHISARGGDHPEPKINQTQISKLKDTFETAGPLPSAKGLARAGFELNPSDDILHFVEVATASGWRATKRAVTISRASSFKSSSWVVRLTLTARYGENLQIDLDEQKCIIEASHKNHSHGKMVLLSPSYSSISSVPSPASFPSAFPSQKCGEVTAPSEADIRLNFQTRGCQPSDEVLRAARCNSLDECLLRMGLTSGSMLDVFEDESWAAILQAAANSRLREGGRREGAEAQQYEFEGPLPDPLPKLKFRSTIPPEFVKSIFNIRISTGWLLFKNPQAFPHTTLRIARRSLHYTREGSKAVSSTYQYSLDKTLPFEIDLSVADSIRRSAEWRDIEGSVEMGMRSCLAAAVSVQEMLMDLEA